MSKVLPQYVLIIQAKRTASPSLEPWHSLRFTSSNNTPFNPPCKSVRGAEANTQRRQGQGLGTAGLIIHEVGGEDRVGEAEATRLIPGDIPCDSRPTQSKKPSRLCSKWDRVASFFWDSFKSQKGNHSFGDSTWRTVLYKLVSPSLSNQEGDAFTASVSTPTSTMGKVRRACSSGRDGGRRLLSSHFTQNNKSRRAHSITLRGSGTNSGVVRSGEAKHRLCKLLWMFGKRRKEWVTLCYFYYFGSLTGGAARRWGVTYRRRRRPPEPGRNESPA